jgi:dCTP deaminase
VTLTDQDIGSEMAQQNLIRHGVAGQLGPACYELRMGRVYYDLTEGNRRIEVGEGETILIKPGHRVVLITLEELSIPHDIIARVVNKGSLFSIGLSPVATYADPGFEGNLGVVTQNISDKYIELPIGESIAKVDFTRLSGSVAHPYQGQHGFQTQIWPIKQHLQKTYEQVRGDQRVESEKAEAYKLLPDATAKLLRNIERRQRVVDRAIVAAVVFNAIFLALISTKAMEAVYGIVGNLVASTIAAAFTFGLGRKD